MSHTTVTAYLNVSDDVLSLAAEVEGHTTLSLIDFQEQIDASATQRIAGAPTGLIAKLRGGKTYNTKTGGDGTQASDYTLATDLDQYKTEAMVLCDVEATRRLELGVEYPEASGNMFSFSTPVQINLNGMRHGRSRLTFPYRISTVDNQDSHDLVDVADCDTLYDVMFDEKSALIQDINTVKHNIRRAVDPAAVDAVATSYLAGGAP